MSTEAPLSVKTRLMIGLLLLIPLSSVVFGMLMLTLASATPGAESPVSPDAPLSKTSWRSAQP